MNRAETENASQRPEIVYGVTIRVQSPLGTVFVTLNENEEEAPFEVFLNAGKCGSDLSADGEAIGRLCTLLLRIPSPVSGMQRIALIVRHLLGIRGSRDTGTSTDAVRSIPDAVAVALSRYMEMKSASQSS